ncbi:MAG TPA: hypothetical protein VMT51_01320 [Dongiaceae bacterium]|nr:hypothetical protein [Dongiaceae bacterium]
MSNEANPIEQAVVRALRDSLERLQRNSDELHHAVADVVAACSSNKPTNALPPLLRAQAGAASLSAALEVLARFISVTLQQGARSPLEAEMARLASSAGVAPAAASPVEAPAPPAPATPAPVAAAPIPVIAPEPPAPAPQAAPPPSAPALPIGPASVVHSEAVRVPEPPAPSPESLLSPEPEYTGGFDVNRLTPEQQELHRRANRVAKVSMQDIKMLRPEQVRLGREHKDLCIRLKDDIEKAHREYDRRFKPIMDHPVDYFYQWMVEILADGDAAALGEYPYAVTARQ